MAETRKARGTVTAMSSEYSPEETQMAANRVQDAIAGRLQEVDRLRGFISDNANLINLVQRLPDQLHHHIMVPFGKAAFFPGRLVHTNEFLVLFGEGYYVETTSKQTVEILKRRSKSLESQINSLNAVVQDLEAEASFFSTTASEIADGILEIREEYVEEAEFEPEPPKQVSSSISEAGKEKVPVDDEEFARIMSRLDVLEKEERDAEANNEGDEVEQPEAVLEGLPNEISRLEMEHLEKLKSRLSLEKAKDKDEVAEEIINYDHHPNLTVESNCMGLTGDSIRKDETQSDVNTNIKKSVQKTAAPAVVENKVQAFPSTSQVSQAPVQTSAAGFDSRKAFSGSIVEHADNIETRLRRHTPLQTSSSQSSKPISRFKMQRK